MTFGSGLSVGLAALAFANALWFGSAFRFFGFQHVRAARVLVTRHDRDNPLFHSMAAIVRFLGGMNGAFALLSGAMAYLWLMASDQFSSTEERLVILSVFGVAHLSQFGFNLPVLHARKLDEQLLWPVTTGPMNRIFVVDLFLGLANSICVAALLIA